MTKKKTTKQETAPPVNSTDEPTTKAALKNPETTKPKEEEPIDVTSIAEFVPYKHYQCSVWRTDEGNVFIKRAQKGVGGTGLKKVFSEGQFSFEASKKKMRLIITFDKPTSFNSFFDLVSSEVNRAILAFHKNKIIDLIK